MLNENEQLREENSHLKATVASIQSLLHDAQERMRLNPVSIPQGGQPTESGLRVPNNTPERVAFPLDKAPSRFVDAHLSRASRNVQPRLKSVSLASFLENKERQDKIPTVEQINAVLKIQIISDIKEGDEGALLLTVNSPYTMRKANDLISTHIYREVRKLMPPADPQPNQDPIKVVIPKDLRIKFVAGVQSQSQSRSMA